MMNTRLARWEKRSEWPLAAAALVFLAAYAWPILQPDLDEGWRRTCSAVAWAVWAMYAADYLIRLVLAERRTDFVRRNLIDLAAVVLPVLRPLRLLRVLLVFDILHERMNTKLRAHVVSRVAVLVAFLSALSALAMLDAERTNPDANIRTYSDALWWAGTTITTVGYGDRYPTTEGGRLVGFGLMLGGIALLGVITAALASWFIEKTAEISAAQEERTEATLDQVLAELRRVRARLDEQTSAPKHL
jgi:voltage-gated potassium channel